MKIDALCVAVRNRQCEGLYVEASGPGSRAVAPVVLREGRAPWRLWWSVYYIERHGRSIVRRRSCPPLGLCQGVPALRGM